MHPRTGRRTLAYLFALLAQAATALCAPAALEIRIIYDNTSAAEGFAADWGFAALVSHGGRHILFDTGTKPDLFAENFRKIGIDAKLLSQVVISHAHADHTGGIPRLAPLNPALIFHFLDRFPSSMYESTRGMGAVTRRVTGPFEVAPGIYSTGTIDGTPPEQALVIDTAQGLVIITGCSHPGIAKMVEAAEGQRGKNSVRLLVGGFHMLNYKPEQIAATVSRLRQLGVDAIMPTHCTGEPAIAKFREAYGAKFGTAGAGKRIVLD